MTYSIILNNDSPEEVTVGLVKFNFVEILRAARENAWFLLRLGFFIVVFVNYQFTWNKMEQYGSWLGQKVSYCVEK